MPRRYNDSLSFSGLVQPSQTPHASAMTSDRTDPSRESLELGGSVWFQAGAQTLGGASRIALLAAIGETGSITSAAKAVGMSYKGAWDAVDTMNNLAGEPLVVRSDRRQRRRRHDAHAARGEADRHVSRGRARASAFSRTRGRGDRRLRDGLGSDRPHRREDERAQSALRHGVGDHARHGQRRSVADAARRSYDRRRAHA